MYLQGSQTEATPTDDNEAQSNRLDIGTRNEFGEERAVPSVRENISGNVRYSVSAFKSDLTNTYYMQGLQMGVPNGDSEAGDPDMDTRFVESSDGVPIEQHVGYL